MPRTYASPPLIEALCEFRFRTEKPWDWTVPGLLYNRIKDEFPTREEEQAGGIEVELSGGKVIRQSAPSGKLRFKRTDGTALVQLAPHMFVTNVFPPYPGWADFKPWVLRLLTTYVEVATPDLLDRIQLRYINRVLIPERQAFEMKEYFKTYPEVPETLPQLLRFTMQIQGVTHALPGRLQLSFGTPPKDTEEGHPFIFDLSFIGAGENCPQLDGLNAWLDAAHESIEALFDSSFTDRTHKHVFREVD